MIQDSVLDSRDDLIGINGMDPQNTSIQSKYGLGIFLNEIYTIVQRDHSVSHPQNSDQHIAVCNDFVSMPASQIHLVDI